MNEITRLSICVGTSWLDPRLRELRITTEVNGLTHAFVKPFRVDDFESHFDHMMDVAKREIRRLVKESEKKAMAQSTS